jgi:hypothetical protein
VSEDDDGCRIRLVLEIIGKPGELVGTEPPKPTGLQIDDVDEANETVQNPGSAADETMSRWYTLSLRPSADGARAF